MTARPPAADPTDRAESSAPIARGRVVRVSISAGGVPKRAVDAARVTRLGLVGDGHAEPGVHGGPMRAVSLLAIEAIRRVAAEGHPLEPGGAGENLTTEGIELAHLPVGTVVDVGDSVRLELTGAAMPCRTIRHNFLEGRFGRLSILTHPSDSRMYARVVREGEVRTGDEIHVHRAPEDPEAARERTLHALGGAESSSVLEMWHAAADTGLDVRIARDGDFVAAAAPELPGGAFNKAYGLDWVPALIPLAVDHFRRAVAVGWLEMREPPWPGAEAEMTLDHFAATPDETARAPVPPGIRIRPAQASDADALDALLASGDARDEIPPSERAAWRAVIAAQFSSRSTQRFVAEADGEVVATAIVHIRHRAGWLRGAIVAPGYRRCGIQRALLATRVTAAAEAGCTLVGASALPDSVSARNLASVGFRRLARRGHFRVDAAEPAA